MNGAKLTHKSHRKRKSLARASLDRLSVPGVMAGTAAVTPAWPIICGVFIGLAMVTVLWAFVGIALDLTDGG